MSLSTRSALLLLLALLPITACRSTPVASPPAPAPRQPAPVPAEDRSDPVVEETRRTEEELEGPAHEEGPPSAAGTVELEFAAGEAALSAYCRARLDELARQLPASAISYPLEILASVEDGSGSERELELLRRRLDAVRDHLQRAGVASDAIRLVHARAESAAEPALAPAVRPRHVFVVVRER